jgi:hypothetical protein
MNSLPKIFVLAYVAFTASSVFAQTLDSLDVPAMTAYVHPNPNGARFSRNGSVRWSDPQQSLVWYGKFDNPGNLNAQLRILQANQVQTLRLSVGDQSHEVSVPQEFPAVVDFGEYQVKKSGYVAIRLEHPPGHAPEVSAELDKLTLRGNSLQTAHFNLKERRNAASVHLIYPVPDNTAIEAFYCEAIGIEDPIHTFYMACGWHRGYFGMQVNGPEERRIIFSVWDSGNEAIDRSKVQQENRVQLVAKGDGVYAGDFGNEGTGGHSHLKTLWKTGEVQRFLVTAEPTDSSHTIFSGFWSPESKQEWQLISSWRAPKEGGYLRRPHSFSENFVGNNGHVIRKARFGNQWIKIANGEWGELTRAAFSHDPTGKSDRLDRWMGIENEQFFLQHGGFVDGFTAYGEKFQRPASKKPPELQRLPDWKSVSNKKPPLD